MTQFEDDFRTLKPMAGAVNRYGALAPPRKTPPPPAPAVKPAPRPPAAATGLTALPARPLCRLFALSTEAEWLLNDKQSLLEYLYRLMKERLFVDAVLLLAHVLPPRDGVRWACECAWDSANSAASEAALAAAEAWLNNPTEPGRRACGEAATAVGSATAAGAAALAVYLSGGAVPTDRAAVAPAEQPAARAVANAVILAALGAERGRSHERYVNYLKEGIALAVGR